MGSKLKELYETTRRIAIEPEQSEEDEFISLVELRDDVIAELSQRMELTADERRMLVEINRHHSSLLKRMTEIRDEASAALDKFKHSRIQKNSYESSYAVESYFIDRKK